MKKILKVLLVVVGLFVLLFAGCVFMMFRPIITVIHASTSQEYANKVGTTNLMFPASARNISYASSCVGMGGRAHIFRFDGPLEDCKEFARQRYALYARQVYGNTTNYPPVEIIPLVGFPEDPRQLLRKSYGLKDLEWFDYQGITNGLTVAQPRSHIPTIWIDVDRSAFYEYWTD